MRRIALVTAAILVVSALAGGLPMAQAAQHGDQGQQDQGNQTSTDGGNQTGGDGANQSDRGGDRGPPASAQERREQARQRAQQAGLFGQLTYQDGTADGRFVNFDLDESSAAVTGYTLKHNGTNTTVFDEVAPESFSGDQPARVAGSQLRLMGEDVHLQALDNPTGLLRYTATNATTVSFDLADGATTGDVKNGSLVKVTADDRNGTIILAGNGTLTASNGTVEAQLDDAGTILFRAAPLGGSPQEAKQARALDRAAADGKLGASVRMAGFNGTPAAEETEFDVNTTPREATDGRARLEISSNATDGRVVNLAVDKGTINASAPDEVTVALDAREIPAKASIDDVVNATDEQARAHVLVTNSTVEVTVYVPDFSIHSLTTSDTTTDVTELATPPSTTNPTGAASSLAQQARQTATSQAQAWADLPSQARENAAQQAQQARLFGAFDVSGGAASGAFVSASVDASAGTLTDVSVEAGGSTPSFLDAVRLDPYTKATEVQEAGPSLALVGQDVTAILHDTPTAGLQVKAGSSSVTVTYELPDAVSLDRIDDEHVKLTADGVHAHLLVASGNGELSLEGDQIRLALGANAQSLFNVHPPDASAAAADIHERLDAVKQGTYGAQVAVASAQDQAVETVQSVSVQAQTKAVTTGEKVTTTVSSQAPDPRVVELDIPKEAVGADASADVEVQVDGQSVQTASSAQDLYAQAGSGTALAHVSDHGDALRVLVNVAGFSDHDVTVQSTDDDGGSGGGGSTDDGGGGGGGTTDDTPAPGLVGLVAAAAIGAALARAQRDR